MYYTYELRDGNAWLADIDVEVYGDLNMSNGDPEIIIDGLFIDQTNILISPDKTVKSLALDIKKAIETDMDWKAELARSEGWKFRTRGGTDPEARWVAA